MERKEQNRKVNKNIVNSESTVSLGDGVDMEGEMGARKKEDIKRKMNIKKIYFIRKGRQV